MRVAKVFRATSDIPSIGARAGEFVLDDGSGAVCVFHGVPRTRLSESDWQKLTQHTEATHAG
ncbi:MAG: hypothetical protein WEE89_00765 [Gemmatimonadota bacterium]